MSVGMLPTPASIIVMCSHTTKALVQHIGQVGQQLQMIVTVTVILEHSKRQPHL